jgi:hypothetical protein
MAGTRLTNLQPPHKYRSQDKTNRYREVAYEVNQVLKEGS